MKISNISDTAFWVAQYRAEESRRKDALFEDGLAGKLAGEKGKEIKAFMDPKNKISWAIVVRTYLFDHAIMEALEAGVDMVVCLASGLDTRPYRLPLPEGLKWVEVDLPGILEYKTETLKDEKPRCRLERIALDLGSEAERQKLFDRLNGEASHILIVSEGLLVYLSPEQVSDLARDLAVPAHFKKWILDLASPGLVKMMNKQSGEKLKQANARFRFGPPEGPGFFNSFGWSVVKVHSFFKTAARFKRVGFIMRLLALLPESQGKQGSSPWSGVCVFERAKG